MTDPTLFDLVNPEIAPDAAEMSRSTAACQCGHQDREHPQTVQSVWSGRRYRPCAVCLCGDFTPARHLGSPLTVGARQTGKTITTGGGWSASTSIEAYRALVPELPQREHEVLIGLRRYRSIYGHWPTSYELFRLMEAEGVALDLNSVRPRLTALWKRERVIQTTRRRCTVTGKTAHTWAVDDNKEV